MTRPKKNILLFTVALFLLGLVPESLFAQFINLQIRIEPELSATVEQELDFGSFDINAGEQSIGISDVNAGLFSVRAYYTQNVFIELILPDELTHINPAISHVIPIDLQIAYNNKGNRSSREAVVLENNKGLLPINEYGDVISSNSPEIWKEMFLFVFGSIYVNDIASGIYESDIVLSIEYD
ncbi:MAG: hypothetical protein ED557_02805 [Balneola sp.]|nr:MAG: hypothetical protein ED557_02805 [Balneola sp.]